MNDAKNGKGALTLILGVTTIIGVTVSIMLAMWGGPRQDTRLSRVEAVIDLQIPALQASMEKLDRKMDEIIRMHMPGKGSAGGDR